MAELRYFDGNITAVGDIFTDKGVTPETNPLWIAWYLVTKITPKRVYYKRYDLTTEEIKFDWEQHSSHTIHARYNILVRRSKDFKMNVPLSGFGKFVKGCDTGKYGKKRRTRKKKDG
jgi:hypothetical protein